jgi:hypothetical protein
MAPFAWLDTFHRWVSFACLAPGARLLPERRRVQPFLEHLEDRTVPSTGAVANNTLLATTKVTQDTIAIRASGINTVEFSALNNITVATFTHANGLQLASDFSAAINWGDGTTTAGTITQSATTYVVQGSHTYNDEGTFTLTVTVAENNAMASAAAAATVGEGPVPVGLMPKAIWNILQVPALAQILDATPPGVIPKPISYHIYETMEDMFHTPLSALQVNSLTLAMMGAELAAMAQMQGLGIDSLTAFCMAERLGQSQFDLYARFMAARGMDVNDAVNEMIDAFLFESTNEMLGYSI